MVVFENVSFLKEDGNEPPNCKVSSTQKVYVEMIFHTDYSDVWERLDYLEVQVLKGANVCVKKFRFSGPCCLKKASSMTYTWRTPAFTLPVGDYYIGKGSGYSYECSAGQAYCSESYMTIPEVSC